MIKTLLACGLAMLGGMQNLNNQESYVDLNGFYNISNSDAVTISTELYNVGDASFWLFDYDTLAYYGGVSHVDSSSSVSFVTTNVQSSSAYVGKIIITEEDDTTTNYFWRSITSDGFRNRIVYFSNFRILQSAYNQLQWEYLTDVRSDYIENKTFSISNLNPVGFTGRNYSDYPFISSTYGTTIELVEDEIAYFQHKFVTSMKLYFYPNSSGSIYFYDGSTTYLYSDTSISYFIMADISYYENDTVVTKTISTPVMKDRVNSSNEWEGSAYTYDLTNLSEDLYLLGYTSLENKPSNLVASFKSYSYGNTSIGSGNIGNVFDLIGQAFNGFGSFFSMTLLPGISLGMLICAPLLVSLLLWLIHMFKKG